MRFLTERGIPMWPGCAPMPAGRLPGTGARAAAQRIRADALGLQEAGATLLVLEAVPAALAAAISSELDIPTIGIGAGPDCDGQVLVLQDMLGLYPRPSPKFSRNFMPGAGSIEEAVRNYVAAVKSRAFPGPEHATHSSIRAISVYNQEPPEFSKIRLMG